MWRSYRYTQALIILLTLLFSLSCGHDRALLGITITPSSVTFLTPNPAQTVQLTAIGTFAHPPGNLDITNQVTWKTATPQIITITNTGLVSPTGLGCGTVGVTATSRVNSNTQNIVIASATITVRDPNDPTGTCPP
jgi:Bacterial Ig-like domain (group 2)